MDVSKLTNIALDGRAYLCELVVDEESGIVVLDRAVLKQGKFSDTVKAWIMRENLGVERETITLGVGQGYTENPLTPKQESILKRLVEDMEEVKKTAMRRMENDLFMGKK